MSKKISIITPTFNEEKNIEKLCSEISKEMSKLDYDYEHIIIDNHSNDQTISILKKIAEKDKKVKIIINTRNFGHIRSPIYGMLQATGDACILMNSDFQDPIELIPQYIREWEQGSQIILGQRSSSDENFFMNSFKDFFYKFINKISDVPLMRNTTGSGLFTKNIVDQIRKIDDPYPYFRGLLSEISSQIKLIQFHQPKRSGGETKNNFYTLYDIGVLGIVKHSKLPLRLMTFIGFFTSIISIMIATVFFFYKILFWNSFEVGVAPLVIGLFTIASIQIFLLGFIGEYVMTILTHTRKLPLVVEKERINF
ncbi:MAG: glycosyltransferase [Candidatus Pelagibacter sp. TMED203]|nr:MAG: glycosyltransferase [Candidatus Pelagibacter sp. TMED203]|tara:strand:+ start:782 stop:1711 length:930 start_codon:yes stop_codon:yes gene_type:complete